MDSSRYFEDDAIGIVLQNARVVVFDLNGLILDDESLQITAANAVLARYGIQFDEETWVRRFFGRRSSEYLSEIIQDSGRIASADLVTKLVSEKDRFYRGLLVKQLRSHVFPGAAAFIKHLHEQGDRLLALATSASHEELRSAMGVSGLDMLDLFTWVVCGEDVVAGKPDPEIYLRVAALSGTAPGSNLVFEDSGLGVQAAVGAGMPVVAVPNRFTAAQNFSGAAMVISDLTRQAKIITPGGSHE